MPPFKDEYILIIAPGSQTTLAQLGLPESLTPAKLRIPTRMFPAEAKGQWEPIRIREKNRTPKVEKSVENGHSNGAAITGASVDVDMTDARAAGEEPKKEGAPAVDGIKQGEEDIHYEEDPDSDEGAVYPMTEGRVTDWTCFLALLTHIHNTLSPPLHTPILIVAQAAWTEQDYETITQFFFEKFKTPAFSIMDAALAVCYAYGVPSATVIDVGYEKADVTAISEFVKHEVGRGVAISDCGGGAMTRRLHELLGPKGWTKDMCEQLKRSNVCEVLPKDTPLPGATAATEKKEVTNPAAAASTGALGSGPGQRVDAAAQGEAPRGPGVDTDVGEDDDVPGALKEDGVLDVAAIVASGKTQEYLARKEREKQEKAAAKKAAADAAAAPAKPARLPNSKREKNVFMYQERKTRGEIQEEEEKQKVERAAEEERLSKERAAEAERAAAEAERRAAEAEKAAAEAEAVAANGSEVKAPDGQDPGQEPTGPSVASAADTAPVTAAEIPPKAETPKLTTITSIISTPISPFKKREIEVSTERFLAASDGILDRLADGIHRTISSVQEVGKRAELWDALVIVGNGSRVRGFKDALISTLTARYLISPSSGTIFTSELPSNLSTPLATGANTPQPHSQTSASLLGGGSASGSIAGGPTAGGNPLLLAATTAHAANANNTPSHTPAHAQHSHGTSHSSSSHSQTPTHLGTLKAPEYFSEWKDVGFEEAAFLGAQVAAKVVFVVDQGVTKGFLTRGEYNEGGPGGGAGVGL